MAARWRDYRVAVTCSKDGWECVYARTFYASSKAMAAFKARTWFPAFALDQLGSMSNITVEVS